MPINVKIPEGSINILYHPKPRLFTSIILKDTKEEIAFFNETYQHSFSHKKLTEKSSIAFSTATGFYATIPALYPETSILGKLERFLGLSTGSVFHYDLVSKSLRLIGSFSNPGDIACSADAKYVFVAEPFKSRVRIFETGRSGSLRHIFTSSMVRINLINLEETLI